MIGHTPHGALARKPADLDEFAGFARPAVRALHQRVSAQALRHGTRSAMTPTDMLAPPETARAMDPTTQAVRAMYEQFPYPAVANPELRLGADARLLLSYGRLPHPGRRPLQVLDAGCGRGNGVLGGAASQPDVRFTGIDINRVTLGAAAAKAKELGLKNIRFQEVDLTTLDGLEVPPGGFESDRLVGCAAPPVVAGRRAPAAPPGARTSRHAQPDGVRHLGPRAAVSPGPRD